MNNSCEIQMAFQWMNVLNSNSMANVQVELELLEIPRSGFSNHRLKMTRALSDQVLRDFRSKEHRYFEACKDYDDCDGHTRGSSRIGVGSIVLIHVPQPVGQGGKLYKRMEGI